MPVEDHVVHELTKTGENHWYVVCRERDDSRRAGYWARDGYEVAWKGSPGTPKWKWVINVLSKDCRYDQSLKDEACIDCRHRGEGEKYATRVRSLV